MAWTEKRAGGWIGRYRINGKAHSTPVFQSKTRARDEAVKAEQDGRAGGHVPRSASKITLNEWFEAWSETRTSKALRTRETEQERYRTLIAPTFGGDQLAAITYSRVARWADSMKGADGKVASQARRRDAVRLLIQILDAAVDAHRLRVNPARTASGKTPHMPRQSRTKAHRYLSHEELQRVADATKTEQARAIVLTAGLTGLRWGELSALTVADVDLLRSRISVSKAYTRLDNGTVVLGDTKTHASREVPLPGATRELLAEQMNGKRKTELVFATDDGLPIRRESFDRHSFKPAVRIAGCAVSELQRLLDMEPVTISGVYDEATYSRVRQLQTEHALPVTGTCDWATWQVLNERDRQRRDGMTQAEKVKRTNLVKVLSRLTLAPGAADFDALTLHDLRHTAASLAISAGASVKAVQRLLGHESAVLTMNTYAGLFDSDLETLAAAMDSAHAAHYMPTTPQTGLAGVTALAAKNAV